MLRQDERPALLSLLTLAVLVLLPSGLVAFETATSREFWRALRALEAA